MTAGSLDRIKVMAANPSRLRAVKEGRRNNSLFRHLMNHAPFCDGIEALLDIGMTFGQDDCDPALPGPEIIKTVDSVWKMKEEGHLWAKGDEPRVIVPKRMIDALSGDALKFYLTLSHSHYDRHQFALAPKAMAKANIIPGWSHHRYRDAREQLLQGGYLKMVHEGGSRPGDPSLFAFSNPPVVMGTKSGPNITRHPPPVGFLHLVSPQREGRSPIRP
jgi:hypothetical protein